MDRLRNKLYRWMGLTPIDDFDYFADDIIRVMESFERFTKDTKEFATVISKRMGLTQKEIPYQKDDRGMFG